MNIAFHMMGAKGWIFGPIYLKNLFCALRRAYDSEHRLFLVASTGPRDIEEYARDIRADGLILQGVPRRWSLYWMINEFVIRNLLSRDLTLEKLLKKHNIDVIFGAALGHTYSKVATLSWLWDFQHIHLPEMFDHAERVSLDRNFLRCARLATRIILMSNAVRKDLETFAPTYAEKVKVLHPVSQIPQSIYDHDMDSILKLYHLPEKFVFLPNQFWKHKNHETVFRAISQLKDQGMEIPVVCAGDPSDYRHPGYFAGLLQKVSQWNVRDQVIYLGLISYEHVLSLMRQSVCVLNPSLFEGWGSTVDEARSIGKRVLLSDIPAHREQNPPKGTFFDPRDCDDLREKLGNIWLSTEPGPDIGLEIEARRDLPDRLRTYADSFVSVAHDAIQEI